MITLKICIILLFIINQSNETLGKRIKFIYEKDLSEYCRRRVVPSIFLGRKVMEANARVLQFSRLELPYSCFISIRTESGSNMVMMIQVMSDELDKVCEANEQLLVYEMGETFGGYWGPLPESVMKRDTLPPKVYTLKTMPSTSATTKSTTDTEPSTISTKIPSITSSEDRQKAGDYVEVEVPLLNVSIHYIPSEENETVTTPDFEELFDLHYDVTPASGVAYDRSMLPLVQFRIVNQTDRNKGNVSGKHDGAPPKYEVDVIENFTPDLRLTWSHPNVSMRRDHTRRYKFTKRLNFKKNRILFNSQRQHDRRTMYETRNNQDVTKYLFPTTTKFTQDIRKSIHIQDSWQVVEDLLKKLDKDTRKNLKTKISSEDDYAIHESITKLNLNQSAYLYPKLTMYYDNKGNFEANKLMTTQNAEFITWNPERPNFNTTVSEGNTSTEPTTNNQISLKSPALLVEDVTTESTRYDNEKISTSTLTTESLGKKEVRIIEHISTELASAIHMSFVLNSTTKGSTQGTNVIGNITETTRTYTLSDTRAPKLNITENIARSNVTRSTITTGSMVGHESWENVVQAAPEMAIFLNQSVTAFTTRANASIDTAMETSEVLRQNVLLKRKVREIHSIPIKNAQPRQLSTKKTSITTTKRAFNVADMQEFAQLVELQDDELHGRVALRYLRQYVGPPLFNLCSVKEPTKPQVYLFNSSRIILSLTNFTLERMVVILTAARALRSGEERCPANRLECQVSGARVCMDSMVACDGVPNCGSYDIYDEDRLLCGHSAALQHNVYLAAFTFLSVLLTFVYAVHYWLKRYVPKVADAFFVYSDGVENVLYLDSIMHSPHEIGSDPKMAYQSHLYADDIDYEGDASSCRNACYRFLRRICCCFRRANKKIYERETGSVDLNVSSSIARKIYSFTELEIRKMMLSSKDTAVQTGDSLQMNTLVNSKEHTFSKVSHNPDFRPKATSYDFSVSIKDSLLTLEEPLPEEHKDELSLLKFFKAARSDSITSASINRNTEEKTLKSSEIKVGLQAEREIEIHAYDRPGIPGPSNRKQLVNENTQSLGSVSKHLRFDEVTTTIPSRIYINEDEDDLGTNSNSRHADNITRHNTRLDPIEEDDEHAGSSREHRHFWGSSKGKKSKKKTQVLR